MPDLPFPPSIPTPRDCSLHSSAVPPSLPCAAVSMSDRWTVVRFVENHSRRFACQRRSRGGLPSRSSSRFGCR